MLPNPQFWVESMALLTARQVFGDEVLAETFRSEDAIENHDFIMRHSNQVSGIVTSVAEDNE